MGICTVQEGLMQCERLDTASLKRYMLEVEQK